MVSCFRIFLQFENLMIHQYSAKYIVFFLRKNRLAIVTCYYISASDDGTHDLVWSRTQDFVTELQSTAVALNQYVTFLSLLF